MLHRIQNAALAVNPALVASAEQTVEQAVRKFFWRERAIQTRPAHILLHGTAERFLGYADLQRTETRLVAQFVGDQLVEGSAATPSSGVGHPGHQGAHRAFVPRAGLAAHDGVVEAA